MVSNAREKSVLAAGKRSSGNAYLGLLCVELSLDVVVVEAEVDNINERVCLDVGRKVKLALWLFNVPFFLEFGGSLTVVCGG